MLKKWNNITKHLLANDCYRCKDQHSVGWNRCVGIMWRKHEHFLSECEFDRLSFQINLSESYFDAHGMRRTTIATFSCTEIASLAVLSDKVEAVCSGIEWQLFRLLFSRIIIIAILWFQVKLHYFRLPNQIVWKSAYFLQADTLLGVYNLVVVLTAWKWHKIDEIYSFYNLMAINAHLKRFFHPAIQSWINDASPTKCDRRTCMHRKCINRGKIDFGQTHIKFIRNFGKHQQICPSFLMFI